MTCKRGFGVVAGLVMAISWLVLIPAPVAGDESGDEAAVQEEPSAPEREIPPAEERARQLTEKMKEKLGLTEEQVPAVTEINLRAATQIDTIIHSGGSRRERLEELRSVQQQRDKELEKVLTKEQWKQYVAIKDELKAEAKTRAKELRKQ